MAPREAVRVACCQYRPTILGSFDEAAAKLADEVARGAATGAEILLFPEYAAAELATIAGEAACRDSARALAEAADRLAALDRVHGDLARRHRVTIVAGSGPARDGDRFVNRARIYAPGGATGFQDKLIMTPFEAAWGVSAGAGLRVFDLGGLRLAIAICYDCEFPLLVRALAEAGAEVVLVPSCTEFLSGWNRVRIGAEARALENQVAAAVSVLTGELPWIEAIDRSRGAAGLYVPPDVAMSETGTLARGELDTPGWVAATIPLARLRQLRETGEMRNFRDWPLQPGAAGSRTAVEVVALEG